MIFLNDTALSRQPPKMSERRSLLQQTSIIVYLDLLWGRSLIGYGSQFAPKLVLGEVYGAPPARRDSEKK